MSTKYENLAVICLRKLECQKLKIRSENRNSEI